jgi:hypothetical protein
MYFRCKMRWKMRSSFLSFCLCTFVAKGNWQNVWKRWWIWLLKYFLGYQSNSGEICFDKTIFTGPKLQFRETVELDLEIWQGNNFRLECLMWCASSNGQLPTKKPLVRINSEEFFNTARYFSHICCKRLCSDHFILFEVKIYTKKYFWSFDVQKI